MKMGEIVVFLSLVVIGIIGLAQANCSGGSGNIWAMHADGSKDDYFAPGEDVYLGGQNFQSNQNYSYEVKDMDAVGSVKPVKTSGYVETDDS